MEKNKKLTAKDVAVIGMAIAVIEVCKIALQGIPNVETTTFWIMMFTMVLGGKMLFVIPAFILIEGCLYGFGLWWFSYLYIWAVLAGAAVIFRKMDSRLGWALLCGFFGLLFGSLTSIPTFILSGFAAGIAYIASGISFDLIHAVSNFLLAFLLLPVLRRLFDKLTKYLNIGANL